MNITTKQLLRIMPGAQDNVERNKNWLSASGMPLDILTATELLNKYAAECGITTKLHWVHFLANIAVESAELRHSEENLNYSAAGLRATWPRRFTEQEATLYAHNAKAIANHAYANRMGNGNEKSGDGWRYRGRGLIGYTGKANYQEYAKWCGYDVVIDPDLMAKRVGAFRSAAHFFATHCLALAEQDKGKEVRKKINGGTLGWEQCQQYIKRAKAALG